MNPKVIALLGHLALAGLFVFGYESIDPEQGLTFLTILFTVVGIWAAIGAPNSAGFSLGIAILIWLCIAVWIFVTVLNKDLAQSDRHSRSEGGQFYLIIANVAVLCLILVSFAIGRVGYLLFTKADRKAS